jgi:hypothetical protein
MNMDTSSFFNSVSAMWIVMALMIVSEAAMWVMMSKMHKKIFERIETLEVEISKHQSKER